MASISIAPAAASQTDGSRAAVRPPGSHRKQDKKPSRARTIISPPQIIPLVDVVKGPETDMDNVELMADLMPN